jgi:nitrite reductase (NADH) large subunit
MNTKPTLVFVGNGNDKVVGVNWANKTVTSEKGITIPHDKVFFATDSFVFVPPIVGNNRPNCLVYRTIEDLEQMVSAAKSARWWAGNYWI